MKEPKPYGLNELREMFLKFFESKEHLRLPSFSLIPQNDASLLLINSGMAPMKPFFTGEQEPPRHRVTTCQKCIRTGDIENIGHTDRHGTDEYNINLSGRRARSVIDYLIESGISPDRLQSQGYGESRPKTITKKLAREYPQFKEGDVLDEEYILSLPEDQQEIADQINRRTEFQVLSIDYQMY